MKDDSTWTLEQFMEKKAREAGGGQFYAVYHRGRKIRTEWARSRNDLINHLSRCQQRWDAIAELV